MCQTWNGRLIGGFAAGECGAAVVCEGWAWWLGDATACYTVERDRGGSAAGGVSDLQQVLSERDGDAFVADRREVHYVGVNYDPATRTINDIACEKVSPALPK